MKMARLTKLTISLLRKWLNNSEFKAHLSSPFEIEQLKSSFLEQGFRSHRNMKIVFSMSHNVNESHNTQSISHSLGRLQKTAPFFTWIFLSSSSAMFSNSQHFLLLPFWCASRTAQISLSDILFLVSVFRFYFRLKLVFTFEH